MNLLGWILRRAPDEIDPAPEIKATPTNLTAEEIDDIVLGSPDDRAVGKRYILEPFFWMIEYSDSEGRKSRRRITMRTVEARGDLKYLNAICHERKALRSFRLDRITCLISTDGEVINANDWFSEILPVSESIEFELGQTERKPTPKPQVSPYTTLKRHIKPALVLLTAAARSDEIIHPREMDRILRFAEDCAFDLRNSGKLPENLDPAIFERLERTVLRLRPLKGDVEQAFDEIAGWPAARAKLLFNALSATASADGVIDQVEAEFIENLHNHGIKQHGTRWNE